MQIKMLAIFPFCKVLCLLLIFYILSKEIALRAYIVRLRLFTESCGMYLFVYEVSLRDRSYNRLRHRAFHGEAVPGDEKLYAKIPQLFVMNQKILSCAGLRRDSGYASAQNDNASLLHVILSEAKNLLLLI